MGGVIFDGNIFGEFSFSFDAISSAGLDFLALFFSESDLQAILQTPIGSADPHFTLVEGSVNSTYTVATFADAPPPVDPTDPTDPGLTPVPLPAGLPLLLVGLGSMAVLRRRSA